MSEKTKVHFFGGAEEVTGSNFLFDDPVSDQKILIDCGMFQGSRVCELKNYEDFPFNVQEIDALIVTHAHLDHIGRVPKLVRDGFRGKIYSTPPTKDLSAYSFEDSLRVLEKEAGQDNRPILYAQKDIEAALKVWEIVEYDTPFKIGNLEITFRESGHILGSAMVEIVRADNKIVFTGDLGNTPSPLLRPTFDLEHVDYLIMESVYGDRNHEDQSTRRTNLEDVIEETIKKGGTLVIPAFSIERTQEILFEIENMMEQSRIPLVPVFLDSPLAIKITSVYLANKKYLNSDVRQLDRLGDGILKFPQLHITMTTDQSKAILNANPRKIIIAGSGMSNGGRIIHHEKNYLSDPKSALLLVGYQAAGSLGRIIQDGAKTVKIMGETVSVNASIRHIGGYSSHKDGDRLFQFVQGINMRGGLKKVFVAMGEPKSSSFLTQRLRDYLGVDAVVPRPNQVVEIDF